MPFWKSDDGSLIRYEIHGRDPARETVLLIPGMLGSISVQWRNFAAPLAEKFQVVLADLRGHGHSENEARELNPEQMADDLAGLLDHLGTEVAHAAGYDLGGYLGLMLHLNRPRQIASLVMQSTKFFWSDETVERMRKELNPDFIADNAPEYGGKLAEQHGAGRWRSLVRQAADLITHLYQSSLTEEMVALAQGPVLVSVGDRDRLVSVREAQQLSRMVGNGSLMVLPGVSHSFESIKPAPMLSILETFPGWANDRTR